EEFAKYESLVKNDTIGFVRGTLDRRRDPAEFVVSKIIPLVRAATELSRGVVVTLKKGMIEDDHLHSLLRHVRNWPGNLDLYFEITGVAGVRRAIYRVGPALKIRYDDQLIAKLKEAAGPENVRLVGHGGATARVEAASPAPSQPEPDLVDA